MCAGSIYGRTGGGARRDWSYWQAHVRSSDLHSTSRAACLLHELKQPMLLVTSTGPARDAKPLECLACALGSNASSSAKRSARRVLVCSSATWPPHAPVALGSYSLNVAVG